MDKEERRREHIDRLGQKFFRTDPEDQTAEHRGEAAPIRKRLSRMPLGEAISCALGVSIPAFFVVAIAMGLIIPHVFDDKSSHDLIGIPIVALATTATFFYSLRYFRQLAYWKVENPPPSVGPRGPSPSLKTRLWSKKLLSGLRTFPVHLSALGILALALVEWREYGIYTLIRFACCAAFVRLSWSASKVNHTGWVWVWGTLAAAYNPFVPLNLGRDIWIWVNLVTIVVLLFDVIRLSPSPLRAFKFLSLIGFALVTLFGIVVGGVRVYQALAQQWAEDAAKEKDLKEQERLAKEKKEGDRALLEELKRRQHLKGPHPPIDYSKYYPSRNRD